MYIKSDVVVRHRAKYIGMNTSTLLVDEYEYTAKTLSTNTSASTFYEYKYE